MTVSATAAPRQISTDFDAVIQTVEAHFAAEKDYQSGDLIKQSDIARVLDELRGQGWELADADEVVQLGLADDSFLVKEFAKPAGRKFMRKVARHEAAFGQLDRLSSISRGKTIVRDLIRQPGGDQFVEYLSTTKSGHRLGGMLADVERGVDLNKPTGRIYTVDDLIGELNRRADTKEKLAEKVQQ